MSSSVAIEVVIEDDKLNAPEMEKVSRTIVVKVPVHASLETIGDKIMERFPVLCDSMNTFYFFDNNGKFRTMDKRLNSIYNLDCRP